MKKLFSLFLICSMILALLAACSGTKSNNIKETAKGQATVGNQSTGEDVKAEETKAAPAPELSIMVQNHPAWPFKEDWLIWDVLEKGANVKFKRYPIQGNWWETIPLIVASGDIPDILWMGGGMHQQYGPEGAVINYFDYLDKMPNFKNFITENPDTVRDMLAADGKLYAAPAVNAHTPLQSFFMYREDIFKKKNIALPQNYDEFYKVLQLLKKLYPDSTPWVFYGLDHLNSLALNFDTNYGYYHSESKNSYVFGPAEDNFKAMVEMLSKFYKEKLISPEFITMDQKQRDDLITNDKAFIFNGYVNNMDNYNMNVRQTNPEFNLAHMAPPAGPTGKRIHSEGYFLYGEGLSVSSNSKHLDDAVKFIDWLYTEQAREAVSWGMEGKSYTNEGGQKKFVKEITNLTVLTKEYGIKSPGTFTLFDNDANLALMSDEAKKAVEEGMAYVAPQAVSIAFTPEEQEVISIKGEAIHKYMEENLTKFIVGQKQLSEWAKYVEGLQKLGLDDIIKIYNDAYERKQSLQLPN